MAEQIDPLLLSLVEKFNKLYRETSEELGVKILLGRTVSNAVLTKRITKALAPLFTQMFADGIAASNKIVKAEVSRLVTTLDVPFKYNKDLFKRLNDKSVFTGYWDNNYQGIYSKGEIDRLKKTVLQAKYGGWTEAKTLKAIKNVGNITTKRALLLARNENARLTSVANQLYFEKASVRKKYDLMWNTSGSNIRPDHAELDGQLANEDGMFKSSKCGLVPGPPLACDPYNCKCYTAFVEKVEEE